jgi:hypothetical protein
MKKKIRSKSDELLYTASNIAFRTASDEKSALTPRVMSSWDGFVRGKIYIFTDRIEFAYGWLRLKKGFTILKSEIDEISGAEIGWIQAVTEIVHHNPGVDRIIIIKGSAESGNNPGKMPEVLFNAGYPVRASDS